MTANPSRLGAASYEVESSWAESTDTFGTRLQIHGEPIIPSDIQQRIAEPITQQYMEEGKLGVRGPWGGQFTVRLALTGHGTAPTGSLSATDLYTVLLNFFGGGSVDQAGTTVSGATSASQFALTGGTVESYNLIRVGSLGDGRGNGQFAAVNNASTITLLTALDATPNVSDVVYAAQMIYPKETASGAGTITSTRWLLQTANGQWKARGCFPMSASFSGLNVGEMPMVDLTYGVSRWEEANETFPDTTATNAKDAAIVAGGSCFVQDVGTATRQTFGLRQWSLNIDMQTAILQGCGGQDSYQTIVGARRTRCAASLSLTIDAEASGTNSFNDIYTGTANQHVLLSCSVANGKAIGWYFQNCVPTSYVTQESLDGLNRRTLNLECLTGTTTTNDETAASWRLAMG